MRKSLQTVLGVSGLLIVGAAIAIASKQEMLSTITGRQPATVEFVGTVEIKPEEDTETSDPVYDSMRREKAALISYARKIEATLRKENRLRRSYSAISSFVDQGGLVISLEDSDLDRVFSSAGDDFEKDARAILKQSAAFLGPFSNPIDIFVYDAEQSESQATITRSVARASMVQRELLHAGLAAPRIRSIAALLDPMQPENRTSQRPSLQIVLQMHFTNFDKIAPRSKAEEVRDLFREFDSRHTSRRGRSLAESLTEDAFTRAESNEDRLPGAQVRGQKAADEDGSSSEASPPADKELLIGPEAIFGPPDPFS